MHVFITKIDFPLCQNAIFRSPRNVQTSFRNVSWCNCLQLQLIEALVQSPFASSTLPRERDFWLQIVKGFQPQVHTLDGFNYTEDLLALWKQLSIGGRNRILQIRNLCQTIGWQAERECHPAWLIGWVEHVILKLKRCLAPSRIMQIWLKTVEIAPKARKMMFWRFWGRGTKDMDTPPGVGGSKPKLVELRIYARNLVELRCMPI